VSGDAYEVLRLPDGQVAAVVSDGMGAGEAAARVSQAAVGLAASLLATGVDPAQVARDVSAALFLRTGGRVFATLDILCVDPSRAEASLVKLGGAPSLVCRGAEVRAVPATAPPAGTVEPVAVEPMVLALGEGDAVVLCTDGIYEAWGDVAAGVAAASAWLPSVAGEDPQAIASLLLAEAAARRRERGDDRTAVVVRVSRPNRWLPGARTDVEKRHNNGRSGSAGGPPTLSPDGW
ncbi:MAG: SpoIIE family protein phosphatase, partial [Clostridia bacterium]|nr:SpoIIE family protein phosphatase [Clostridia bacterium]